MAYVTKYAVTDISNMVVDVFGSAVHATLSWIDLLVLLAVVGIILSIVMGLLFKVSRVLGLG
jgi:hypothetical protein